MVNNRDNQPAGVETNSSQVRFVFYIEHTQNFYWTQLGDAHLPQGRWLLQVMKLLILLLNTLKQQSPNYGNHRLMTDNLHTQPQ